MFNQSSSIPITGIWDVWGGGRIFRTIYGGQESSRNRVVVPAHQGFIGWRNLFLGIDSWAPRMEGQGGVRIVREEEEQVWEEEEQLGKKKHSQGRGGIGQGNRGRKRREEQGDGRGGRREEEARQRRQEQGERREGRNTRVWKRLKNSIIFSIFPINRVTLY